MSTILKIRLAETSGPFLTAITNLDPFSWQKICCVSPSKVASYLREWVHPINVQLDAHYQSLEILWLLDCLVSTQHPWDERKF